MSFDALEQIVKQAGTDGHGFFRAIMEEDMEERQVSREESFGKMQQMYAAMRASDAAYDRKRKSASGFVGTDGDKLEQLVDRGQGICGSFMDQVMTRALKMGENNACMGRIVAAPTAGSCGVLPAVLLTWQDLYEEKQERMVEALYVAAGIGEVIASRASISGAEGGCQAEIGSAAAMAAPALVHLQGGTPEQMANACAMAVKNLLGLVCDPVGGLVEVPCVKRNVIGAMDALSAAQMALAGIESRVPPDQVLDAMREVGQSLPHTLRETGKGGLAATPFGLRYTPKEADKR